MFREYFFHIICLIFSLEYYSLCIGETSTEVDWTRRRVWGESDIGLNEFPWQALLIYSNRTMIEFGCGGALITENYVLTAAHCVSGNVDLKSIRFGEYNMNSDQDCQWEKDALVCSSDEPVEIPILKIVRHPKYDPTDKNKHHDIALIKLIKPIKYSNSIQSIPLPSYKKKSDGLQLGNILESSGWGLSDYYGYFRDNIIVMPIKTKTTLSYIDEETCKRAFDNLLMEKNDGQFCASRFATCPGDTGNPVVQFSKEQKIFILVGIFSVVSDCDRGLHSVHTRVYKYLDWIHRNINK